MTAWEAFRVVTPALVLSFAAGGAFVFHLLGTAPSQPSRNPRRSGA